MTIANKGSSTSKKAKTNQVAAIGNSMSPYGDIKIPIKLTYNLLLSIAQLVITRNKDVTGDVLISAYRLFSIINTEEYKKDYKSLALLCFIKSALEARVDKRITKINMVIEHIMNTNVNYKDFYTEVIREFTEDPLNATELDYVIDEISKQMSLISIIKNKKGLQTALTKFESEEYRSPDEILNSIVKECTKMLKDIRDSHVEKSDTTLDTTQANFKAHIGYALDELRASSNRLDTGFQFLNRMMNGGAENKRVYTFAAPPSGGKSLLALNLALQIKKYNAGPKMVQKDGAIPIVLFITHENTITETIERLYGITVSSNPIYSSQESNDAIINKISEVIEYDPQIEGDIGIRLHYMPSYQSTVNDILHYIEDLEDKGYKVITLIHDYIKKIRPNVSRNEQRLDLAQVVDDFKSVALLKNIPIILLTQVSRMGFSGMEEALRRNNPDALKDSSRTIIGESWGIVENSDWVTIVLRVPVMSQGKIIGYQMSFLNTKARNGNQNTHFFFQPFDTDLPLKLLPDSGAQPLGQESLLVTFKEMEDIANEEITKGKNQLSGDIKDGRISGVDKNDAIVAKYTSDAENSTATENSMVTLDKEIAEKAGIAESASVSSVQEEVEKKNSEVSGLLGR